jgi:hypothetical protein
MTEGCKGIIYNNKTAIKSIIFQHRKLAMNAGKHKLPAFKHFKIGCHRACLLEHRHQREKNRFLVLNQGHQRKVYCFFWSYFRFFWG